MKFIFDMDGVIVDSFKAVKAAYRKAGAGDMSEHWGKPWTEWCTKEVHDEKIRVYPNVLRDLGRVLPAASFMKTVDGEVITSACYDAVLAVKDLLRFDFRVGLHTADKDTKKHYILDQAKRDSRVIYVDDDLEFGKSLMGYHSSFHFMHATELEGVFNLYGFQGRVQRWTLSSWLPAATTG